MTLEASSTIERVCYEVWLYGSDVYYGFAQYCFWRMVVASGNPDWRFATPAYFLPKILAKGGHP